MKEQVFEQWINTSRAALQPVLKLTEITGQAMEQVAQQQLDLVREYMDLGARQLQVLGEAKDPQKWIAEEGKLAAEFGQKLVDRAEEFYRLAQVSQKAVVGWAEETAKVAQKAA
jgi:phasin family protein